MISESRSQDILAANEVAKKVKIKEKKCKENGLIVFSKKELYQIYFFKQKQRNA